MTQKKPASATGFDAFLKRITSPIADAGAELTHEIPVPTSDDFGDYVCLIEASYHDINVAVSKENLATHQMLCDYEAAQTKNKDEQSYWKKQRAPKMVDDVPHLSLADAMDACDHRWAESNNLLTKRMLNGETTSPQCDKLYNITTQLFAHVWNGLDADHLEKRLEAALYDPAAKFNILNGSHSAKQVAETILDLAHAHRVELKGPNREI